ncbi:MAG TPA: pyruvate dehydrogenase (acetyl-transferring), homodimeric type, partial [Casimicrobiaceae bacterium]|nr:pyruvate dehydrogenase (acetyl-transferring), homodimeric type [Casimicrobiaceae bacterium]
PELKALVADLSDEEVWKLNRGGHDPFKVYAAYAAAVKHKDQPTVILAKTVKGYGMGESGEGQMIAHQAKKMTQDALKQFRDRFDIPMPDDKIESMPFISLPADSPEMKYLQDHRASLGGHLPQRRRSSQKLTPPPLSTFDRLLQSSGEREISTTMAFVQMLGTLLRDKGLGKYIVPIVPDESRTFGMEGLFRQLGIYSAVGQLYKPQDADQLMYYREDKAGQVLQEGINEAGAMSSWIAAATSYSTNDVPMIPFYIYYSMFGLQRVGDLAWAAGDMRCRGFLLGGTAGRTTLNGEGLQHEDGHSHVLASTIPNCVSYDPTFAYEVVVIIRDGIRRMFEAQEDVYYYVTLMNENYRHPAMPAGAEEGIIKGLYLLQEGRKAEKKNARQRVQLMGSGTILREVIAAADLLRDDWNVDADLWSATSFNELRRDGMSAERFNLLHPTAPRRKSYIESALEGHAGPVIAATDYMRSYAEQVRRHIPRRYEVLGTDGFGRSDYRAKLRQFFEVNRYYVAVAALKALADDGALANDVVAKAIAKYGLDTERPDPWKV